MADGTKIEWATTTWSPVTGCTPISEGCKNCYAKKMASRLRGRYGYSAEDPFGVTIHQDKMTLPSKWRKSRKIFVSSMGDLFHKDVPGNAIMDVIGQVIENPRHIFLFLTKRPNRMRDILQYHKPIEPIPNLWIGVTTENQRWADKRIPILLDIPATVRFISVEPMLGSIRIGVTGMDLDWIICGAETGPGARPMEIDWALDLYGQCKGADIPFFLKKVSKGRPLPTKYKAKNMREWPHG